MGHTIVYYEMDAMGGKGRGDRDGLNPVSCLAVSVEWVIYRVGSNKLRERGEGKMSGK
jgi:hypothetical protein